MSKEPSPLLGYNNNVRHKGRVFHVQTEDSGVKRPHIITHLFMDGGRILKSVKKSYAEFVGSVGMAGQVREMMKEQHKEMLLALRDGHFDDLLEGALASNKPKPSSTVPEAIPSDPVRQVHPTTSGPPARPALLPPSPTESKRPSNRPRPMTYEHAHDHAHAHAHPAHPNAPPSDPAQEGRYAPSRPAAVFGQARPSKGASIFGEDLISDKSLDEVILSYLAEDLEPSSKKR